MEPEDSLGMTNEELSTIPKKELGEVIKYSIEDLVLIPSETEDTSESDSDCDLPSGDDFSPINISEEKSVTFSNPLFDSNDDFTSSDDKSLSDEDVPKENVKIYSNPLFELDDEYISSNVNPLFDEDEFVAPGDDIEFLLHRDPSTPTINIVSILEGFIDELPLEENDDLFDLESKTNDWKKVLYTAPIDDLMTKDKFFDPGGDIDEIDVVKINPNNLPLFDDDKTNKVVYELHHKAKASLEVEIILTDAFLDVDFSTDIEDGYHDSEGDIIYLESLLNNDNIPYLPPEVFLDHDPKSLSDNDNLKSIVQVFDPEIHEKNSSPTY
ncbi:hypothetical protein Tco_0519161, partial [Tanacetum coccineum]